MATVPRSGGKIVRARRTTRVKTPYDRPNLPNLGSQNPNWFSRFVFSPTRSIATGAGKLLLSAIHTDSSESSSDTDSEDEIATDCEDDVTYLPGDDESTKKSETLKLIDSYRKEPQPAVLNRETKHVIEQLLIQETFSREECDRLTEIIRSRVVDCPTNRDAKEGGAAKIPDMAVSSDLNTHDLQSTAIMEAKKWLREKKSIFDSESDVQYRTCSSLPFTLPQASEDEAGSPANIAKSYMQARPPWASPSADHISSPSSVRIKLFKEETPCSIHGNSTSSSKLKRNSRASGSWNIQDEMRRVRIKATEEMLRTLPSTKINWSSSSFSLGNKNNVKSSTAEKLEPNKGDVVHNPTKLIDASSNGVMGLNNSHASPVMERKQDAVLNKASLSGPVIINSEQNQGLKVIPIIEGSQQVCRGIISSDKKIRSLEHIKTVAHRLLAGQGVGKTATPCDEGNSLVSSSHGTTAKGNPDEEVCELLSEASMEVPDVNVNDSVAMNEDDGVANGSQNSSSMRYDELQHDQSHQQSEWTLAAKTNSNVEKPGRRITRYNRRGRGRGRGRARGWSRGK